MREKIHHKDGVEIESKYADGNNGDEGDGDGAGKGGGIIFLAKKLTT